MNRENRFGGADIAMVATTFLWGLNTVISKNAMGDTPESFRVFIYNGLRIPGGAILLFLALKMKGKSIAIQRKHILYCAVLSFFGLFMFMVTFILGVSLTSSANTGIILAMTPILIIVISLVTGTENPTKRIFGGILVGFCGMTVLTFKRGGISFNVGDVLILCSCCAWAIHTVYGKKLLHSYSPMVVIAWLYLFTSLYQLPFALYHLPSQDFSSVSQINWFYLFVSVFGSVMLANTLYYYSVGKIGPSKAGVYTNLTPVFTLLLAVAIRGETITIVQILGLVLIVCGIALSKSRPNRGKKS
ncbi:DMT family transporter [Candidatus Omnitrophota bacterium]